MPPLSGRLPFAPVPELVTAECTVVDGTAKEKQQPAKGISGHRVNPVFCRELAQVSRTALRTFAVAPEQSNERPPPVSPQAAILAFIKGAIDESVKYTAGPSDNRTAAGKTGRH
jgi:hypothetical protein